MDGRGRLINATVLTPVTGRFRDGVEVGHIFIYTVITLSQRRS